MPGCKWLFPDLPDLTYVEYAPFRFSKTADFRLSLSGMLAGPGAMKRRRRLAPSMLR